MEHIVLTYADLESQDRRKLIQDILMDTPCSSAEDDVKLHEITFRSEKVIVSDKCV